MRPPDLRHNSIARSTVQAECGELSTGAKISRYTGTSGARVHAVPTPMRRRAHSRTRSSDVTAGGRSTAAARRPQQDYRRFEKRAASMDIATNPVKYQLPT